MCQPMSWRRAAYSSRSRSVLEGAGFCVEGHEVGVGFFGGGFAVVAGGVGEDVEFVEGEAFEVAVFDQVERVFVMAGVADVPADVVEQGCIFQKLAFCGPEFVEILQLVK